MRYIVLAIPRQSGLLSVHLSAFQPPFGQRRVNRAAKIDVKLLKPTADAEYRHPKGNRLLDGARGQPVTRAIPHPSLNVRLACQFQCARSGPAEDGRIDIRFIACQNQTVEPAHDRQITVAFRIVSIDRWQYHASHARIANEGLDIFAPQPVAVYAIGQKAV